MEVTREHLAGLELALDRWNDGGPSVQFAAHLHDLIAQAKAAPTQNITAYGDVTPLPDGSAFAVVSYPLPHDHWLYAERVYAGDAIESERPAKPILTHELREKVIAAIRYAIRASTNCGKELDFDPDSLVQNAVYALCGPYKQAAPKEAE